MSSPVRRYEGLIYSVVGVVALFFILVAANYLASNAAVRADLTEGNLYTLSPGTKQLLRELPAPVKLKLYISSGETMPVPLRSYARRVVDLVEEFKAAAGANLVIERYDPRPDSEAEDAAQLDGIEPQTLGTGEQFYLGLAASRLDRKHAIPVLAPARERLLEYDLVRAIARAGSGERPKIGVMSGLPVFGEKYNPYTRQSSEPWVLANELRRDFDVQQVNMSVEAIDPDISVLLLIHPANVSPQIEYALDQFVLRGGKLIAFVDPYAYFDPLPMPPGMPPQVSNSTLPTLFKAWGIGMAPNQVVSDVVFGSGEGQRFTPTVLTLNRTAFDRDDVVMSQIETLLYAFGGGFEVDPPEGLRASPLMQSSPNSMLVGEGKVTATGEEATRGFVPGGKAYALALRLTGTFRTAFPEGRPPEGGAKPKPAAASGAHLTQSAREGSVVLVADVDLLQDGAAVDVQEVFGRRIIVPSNGNLAFAQGLVEQLAAGESLLGLKSRAAAFRPLTVVREMEAQAQLQYFGKIKELEDELQKTNEALQALQAGAPQGGAQGAQILSPEQQAELDRFRKKVAETRLALKELRRNLRHDAEQLVFFTKVANIALMPLLVALAGLAVAAVRRRRQARLAAA